MRGIFTFLFVFLFSNLINAQLTQDARFPTIGQNFDRLESNQTWVNPERAISNNDQLATATFGNGAGANSRTDYLYLRSFGFNTISGLPNGYTITGIQVTIDATFTNATGRFQIVDANGSGVGTPQGFTTGTNTYGSSSQTFGATLTTTDVKDADFGIFIYFDRINQGVTANVAVDYASIKIYYTNTAPTATNDQFGAGSLTETIIGNVITKAPADSDPSNETLTAIIGDKLEVEASGTFTFNSDGSFSFTPSPSFNGGQISFTYRVRDNGLPLPLTSEEATVTLIYPERSLPVEFISFDAKKADNGVQLTWKVGTEVDVDRYEVERSSNGSSFTKIGTVTATHSSSYSFKDLNHLSGTAYYRVRNVDRDGQFKYTTVAKYSNGKSEMQFKAFPTSTKGQVTFQHPSVTGRATITVHTLEGRTVRSVLPAQGAISTQVDLSALPAGTYLLKYQSESGSSETFRIIKQ